MYLTNFSAVRVAMVSSLLAIGLAMSGAAQAASQCKGLDNEACDAAAACGWVNGYERKDGRKVSAFCRTKSSTAKKSPTKPSAKAPSSDNKKG